MDPFPSVFGVKKALRSELTHFWAFLWRKRGPKSWICPFLSVLGVKNKIKALKSKFTHFWVFLWRKRPWNPNWPISGCFGGKKGVPKAQIDPFWSVLGVKKRPWSANLPISEGFGDKKRGLKPTFIHSWAPQGKRPWNPNWPISGCFRVKKKGHKVSICPFLRVPVGKKKRP